MLGLLRFAELRGKLPLLALLGLDARGEIPIEHHEVDDRGQHDQDRANRDLGRQVQAREGARCGCHQYRALASSWNWTRSIPASVDVAFFAGRSFTSAK